MSYKFLPLDDRISLAAFSIDQHHNAGLSTHHVPEYIFKIRFIFMFVEEINDFFFEQLALEHILDDQLLGAFYFVDGLL